MTPEISTIPLRQMASGDILHLQVYKFIGDSPGKKVYIQSNLHGAEIVGNAVIYEIIKFLQSLNSTDLQGEIWLVPVCNPMGTNARSHYFASGRYDAYEYRDWNRIFWDYEQENEDILAFAQSQLNLPLEVIQSNYLHRIQASFTNQVQQQKSPRSATFTEKFSLILQSLSLDADYLIDLHSSTNQGLNYLYYFPNREESAKYFGLDFGILLDQYDGDAFDEAFIKPWLALENNLGQLGREVQFDIEAWTLELGRGMEMQPDAVSKGVAGLKSYLINKGVINFSGLMNPPNKQQVNMIFKNRSQVIKYFAAAGGMIQERVALGSEVEAGEKIYQILSFNKQGNLPTIIDVYAEAPGLVYDISTNQAVNEGEYVMGII